MLLLVVAGVRGKMTKKSQPTSFRLSKITTLELQKLMSAWGLERGAAVARAIALAVSALKPNENGQKN